MLLTESDWEKVFKLRCQCKLGFSMSKENEELLILAWKVNPNRYKAMGYDIFKPTAPFGYNR